MEEKNAGKWPGRVERSKEEIPGSKRSMYGNILTYSRLKKGERLNFVFSPDGTLISASAAPHCGVDKESIDLMQLIQQHKHQPYSCLHDTVD